jgi:tRNA threonylcarbamoyl adenosine modification protein (Sua5/YciO/YrdC/YwlC family)
MSSNKNSKMHDVDLNFEESLHSAKQIFSQGDVFILPTDTFYSLVVNPLNNSAVDKIKGIFGKDFIDQSTFLIDSVSNLIRYIEIESERHLDFLISIWPNPIRVIFNLNSKARQMFGLEKAAFKIPNYRFCLRLLAEMQIPLLSIPIKYNYKSEFKYLEMVKLEYLSKVAAFFYSGKVSDMHDSAVVDLSDNKPMLINENQYKVSGLIEKYY